MDENSTHHQEPLISTGASKSSVIWIPILKMIMWAIFIAWISLIVISPLNPVISWLLSTTYYTSFTFLGMAGFVFLIYSGPILIIAFLSVPYLFISGKDQPQENMTPKRPSYRLSTFPLFVDGPFGVVSAAELIGILLVLVYAIWDFCAYIFGRDELSTDEERVFILAAGHCLGLAGLFCLGFLFIPIARGSILLRLIDIPFGHAARYHVWLGHFTMIIFTLHGLFYVIGWSMEGTLLQNILDWPDSGASNLAGAIALLAGLLMWIAAIPPVRKHFFEVFFYTHQLYVLFIIFFAMHVGLTAFAKISGTIFLFMIDRFLRFFQSRKTVDIVSATAFPSGIVKLVLLKPQNLPYNALSFVFLRIREVSRLQWHPFSISSSSKDGEHHISVLIKVLGGWTAKMKENVSTFCEAEAEHLQLQSMITASVEGPYGHELQHHLMYENLILVSGGVGISPFLAILSDISHCIKLEKPCLLKNLLVVWAVKRSNELSLLSTIDMKSIYPYLSYEVNLDIQIYITRESQPPLEDQGAFEYNERIINSFACPFSNGRSMSGLTSTGNIVWFGTYIITTTIGFFILMCLLNVVYINPYSIPVGWYQAFLFVACMVASVFIFGGLVVALWYFWETKFSPIDCEDPQRSIDISRYSESSANKDLYQDLASSTKIRYGSRPNFKDIFESISERWGYIDAGVIVCGPWSLESSVAKECRSKNMRRQNHHPIFHFHSHSFSL